MAVSSAANSTFICSIGTVASRRPNSLLRGSDVTFSLSQVSPQISIIAPVRARRRGFDQWLVTNAYTRGSRRYSIGMLQHVDADLRRRQIRQVADLTCRVVDECWRALIKTHPSGAGTVHALRRYLAATGLMMGSPPTARATSPISGLVEEDCT